jgi:hypothetical protein
MLHVRRPLEVTADDPVSSPPPSERFQLDTITDIGSWTRVHELAVAVLAMGLIVIGGVCTLGVFAV